MEMRALGPLSVSVVGLGCNNFGMRIDADDVTAVVGTALDEGVTFFDTADVYTGGASEELLGKALGSRRDEAVIATKFGSQMHERVDGEVRPVPGAKGASPAWIARAVEDSLSRLGTDRIDLYQLHLPDPDTPIADTLEALDRLVGEGKVRAVGCSNFSPTQIDEAMDSSASGGWTSFVSVQNHYSLLHRDPERGVADACTRHGLSLLPYFPLACGLLTGKYRSREDLPEGTRLAILAEHDPERAEKFLAEEHFRTLDRLRRFCEARGRTLLELAFSWLASRAVVPSVIAGATSSEQLRANASAAGWSLTDEELDELDRLAPV